MPRPFRLPSGPQRLALAEGHDAVLLHPDFAPQARHADARFNASLFERIAALPSVTADMLRALTGDAAEAQDGWAPEVPEWAPAGDRTSHGYTLIGNVAFMSIEGFLMAKGFEGWWSGCYWPGYRDYVAALKAANEDERVDGVFIRYDTPGGYVSGCAEAARAVRAMRADNGGKPIVGHAADLCASAGMMLAAQCDVFYAGDGATVGSVGVRLGFFDYEGALEKWGERAHMFKSGRLKDMGSPLRAPTDEEAGIYQAEVDHFADRFYVELAAGRGLDLDAVREHRGWEARTFTAGDPPPPADMDPLAADLIDGVMTEEQAFEIALQLAASTPSTPSASTSAVVSRAAGKRDSDAAVSKEKTMSLKAKAAALKARAATDPKAQAELEDILKALGAVSEDDDAEGADGDDDAESEGEDDDAEADGDDDAEGADGDDDDDEEASDDEDDEPKSKAAAGRKIARLAAAQGKSKLGGQLAADVAGGETSYRSALRTLKAAGRESGALAAAMGGGRDGVRPAKPSEASSSGARAKGLLAAVNRQVKRKSA